MPSLAAQPMVASCRSGPWLRSRSDTQQVRAWMCADTQSPPSCSFTYLPKSHLGQPTSRTCRINNFSAQTLRKLSKAGQLYPRAGRSATLQVLAARRPDVTVRTVAVDLDSEVSDRRPRFVDVLPTDVPSTIPKQHLSAQSSGSPSDSDSLAPADSGSTLPSGESGEGPLGGPLGFLENKFSPRVRGLILLNILTFLYGTNVTVVKEAEALLDPFSFSLGRFGIAALAFLPFLGPALKKGPIRRAGLELGIWASLAYVTQGVGLLTCDAGRAAFIGTFTVIEVPIIAGLFGARIPQVTWWSAAAAVLGVGLLESSGSNSSFMGDFWTIVSALIFGFHMLRSEHHTRHIPRDGALPLIALQLLVTALMSVGWLVGMSFVGVVPDSTWHVISSGDWGTVSSWPWLQMAYTGVLSTAFCLWVEVVSLRDVSASEAAMVYTLEPLYGAGFAWMLLGERWGPLGWVGAAFILGGSVSMQVFGHVECAEDEPEEIEAHKSSAAILGALGAAAAVALLMAASGGVPSSSMHETLSENVGAVEAVAWMEYGDAELENLATFMRAYAMMKSDAPAPGGDGGDDGGPFSALPLGNNFEA